MISSQQREARRPFLLTLAWSCLALTLLASASALTCDVEAEPIIIHKVPAAFCIVNGTATHCVTWLSDPANASEAWGTMPEPEAVAGIGLVDAYAVRNHSVAVEFSRDRLMHGVQVGGHVLCGSEQYDFNMTPVIADYQEAGEAAIWTMTNILTIGFLIVVLGILAIIIYLILRRGTL